MKEASTPRTEKTTTGEALHYAAGALIEREGKYLLIDRVNIPYGFAGLAGHVDEGEEPEVALRREVLEESGISLDQCSLIAEEEVSGDSCVFGVRHHYWYLYRCQAVGEPVRDPSEAKSMGWYTPEEIRQLTLEPVWEYWFKKFGII